MSWQRKGTIKNGMASPLNRFALLLMAVTPRTLLLNGNGYKPDKQGWATILTLAGLHHSSYGK